MGDVDSSPLSMIDSETFGRFFQPKKTSRSSPPPPPPPPPGRQWNTKAKENGEKATNPNCTLKAFSFINFGVSPVPLENNSDKKLKSHISLSSCQTCQTKNSVCLHYLLRLSKLLDLNNASETASLLISQVLSLSISLSLAPFTTAASRYLLLLVLWSKPLPLSCLLTSQHINLSICAERTQRRDAEGWTRDDDDTTIRERINSGGERALNPNNVATLTRFGIRASMPRGRL